RSRDDVDSVLARQRTSPPADRVIVAAIVAGLQSWRWGGVEGLELPTVFSVRGQSEKGKRDVCWGNSCLRTSCSDSAGQQRPQLLEPNLEIVRRPLGVRAQGASRLVYE